MPDNYTSLMIMTVVLVLVCGMLGVWALRSRRRNRNPSAEPAGKHEQRDMAVNQGQTK